MEADLISRSLLTRPLARVGTEQVGMHIPERVLERSEGPRAKETFKGFGSAVKWFSGNVPNVG